MRPMTRNTTHEKGEDAMIKPAIFLTAMLLSAAPAWAINKCTGPDGKTVFQDAPCQKSGITVAEDIEQKKALQREKQAAAPSGKKTDNSISEDVQRQVQAAMRSSDEALTAARARCKNGVPEYPSVGMSEADFRGCTQFGVLFPHKDLNQTETAAGVSKQFVYSGVGSAGIRFVYTRNGVVTAIQR